MPEVQQNMMSDAFKQESEQMEEALKDEEKLNKHISTKSISNQYIQDLYRFYTINPHHTDFKNPLKETLEFYKSPLFSIIFKEESRRKRISEFFFSKNLYVESLAQFLALINQGLSDVSSYQKIAFCYQQLMEYDNAIEYYQKAELLDPNNSWTLTRLAYCYRRIQQFEQAMNIYHKLQELYPEQLQYQSYLAGCYYELGKFDEALNLYYKLDYLQPNQPKNWRFIAWCSFVAGKLEQSEKYYAKLVALPKPDSVDFLNAGHLAWIQNKLQLAHHYYLSAKVVMKDSNNKELRVVKHLFGLSFLFIESGIPNTIAVSIIY